MEEGVLKTQELRQGVSDKGVIQSCSTGQYEKTDVFFEQYLKISIRCLLKILSKAEKLKVTAYQFFMVPVNIYAL